MTLQWLKDSNESYSYARVVGFVCIIGNLIWRLYMGVSDINNCWQAIVACSGFITGICLWGVEIVRDIRNITVKIAGKEYEYKKEK